MKIKLLLALLLMSACGCKKKPEKLQFIPGQIDHIKVYDRALTREELKRIYWEEINTSPPSETLTDYELNLRFYHDMEEIEKRDYMAGLGIRQSRGFSGPPPEVFDEKVYIHTEYKKPTVITGENWTMSLYYMENGHAKN